MRTCYICGMELSDDIYEPEEDICMGCLEAFEDTSI
jgi:hypothetical protein